MRWTEWGEGAMTAAEVRKLPDGTHVFLHYKDRYGVHRRKRFVVFLGTGKFLYDGSDGLDNSERLKPIRCTKNQYFTLADDD